MPLDAKGRQKIASTNPDSAEEASLLEKAAASDDPSVLAGEARPSPSPLLLPARGVFAAFVLLVVIIGWLSARYGPPAKERRPAGSVGEIVYSASRKALGGGLSGAAAGVAQVILLMWLRTTMNYQYRHGSSTCAAMRTLYAQGGVPRFYQGLPYALLQTPLSRFGDTAANTGMMELFAAMAWGANVPIAVKTGCASAAGSLWRILITPLDTLKTTLQVDGAAAYKQLGDKVKREGPVVLYQGALANAVASFVGSYPWFFAFNLAMRWLPAAPVGDLLFKLVRSAVAGVIASFVSDVFSNFIRVLKTTRQTSPVTITYKEAIDQIIAKDGVIGLFTRGLGTRILTNALQASMFTVVWKYLEGRMA
uniref:Mitochondrial carrier protein n=1 Tax=Emiliania huxleyi TaxID=2903 RepID=A0A7S3SXT4_EMIHU